MNLIDANLLLYAYNSASEHHVAARRWIEQLFSSPQPVGLASISVLAFLRLSTSSRVFARPLSEREAIAIVGEWLSLPQVRIFDPGPRFWAVFTGLILDGQVRGALMSDAFLAAIAIENGLVLCTNDRDFSRFDELRALNPLT